MELKHEGLNYEVVINTETNHGSFEHLRKGEDASGGLWFDTDKRLIDYDGMFTVPKSVIASIRQLGYVVPREFEK